MQVACTHPVRPSVRRARSLRLVFVLGVLHERPLAVSACVSTGNFLPTVTDLIPYFYSIGEHSTAADDKTLRIGRIRTEANIFRRSFERAQLGSARLGCAGRLDRAEPIRVKITSVTFHGNLRRRLVSNRSAPEYVKVRHIYRYRPHHYYGKRYTLVTRLFSIACELLYYYVPRATRLAIRLALSSASGTSFSVACLQLAS